MNAGPLAQVEYEVLRWPGVSKTRVENGPAGIPVTAYQFEGREVGHVHHGGVDDYLADFRFPREVRDELIRSARAIPHPAFPKGRTTGTS
jgi:hypothetical protein